VDRIAPLAGVRFAAALGILLFHYGGPLVDGGPAWAGRLVQGGHAWVSLFYVLSGFVLARAHPEPMGPAERRAFWTARLARIYPAYVLGFVLSAPFAIDRWTGAGAAGLAKAALVAAAALLLVHAWVTPVARLWNPPGWSTSAIATFYALFPFAAARLSRLSRRGLALAAAGAWLASVALALGYLAAAPDGPVADLFVHEPPWLEAVKFHPLARIPEFLAGVALGLLHRRGLRLGRAAPAAAWIGVGGALALLAWGRLPFLVVHNGGLLPLFAAALLGLAEGRGLLARLLASRPARTLGDASFALYVLQDPLWRIAKAGSPWADAVPPAGFVLAFCAGAVALSLGVARWLERPARRAVRERLA
jgi:peptidoglycan/LPS O-acetylase OafA/YrhL